MKNKKTWFESQVPEKCEIQRLVDVKYEEDKGFKICLQQGIYHYPSGITEKGFRFIRRRPNGMLQTAPEQACIPSIKVMEEMIAEAKEKDWDVELSADERYGKVGENKV